MVVTRRSRSEDEDGPLLGRQQQQQRPPPPPPPMIGNNAVGNNNLNQNNAINIGDAGSNENEVHATNNIIEAVAMNSDNSFLQVRALPPQSIQSSTVTSPFRPFHIHKRKNYAARASSWPPSASAAQNTTHNPSSQSASERRGFLSTSTVGGRKQNVTKNIHNNMTSQQQHQQQQSPSLPSSTSTYTDGEIVRILLPPNGFASERHLAECLRQAGETTTATTTTSFVTTNDTVQHHHDDYDDNASWDSMDEYYCDYNYYLSNQRERESSHYNRFSGGIQNSTAVVAGMFRESDRVFIPLSLIYANPTLFVGDVLSLKRPPPPPPAPSQPQPPRRLDVAPSPSASLMWQQRRPMFIQFLEIFGIVIVAMTSWWSYSAASRIDWGHVTDVMITKFEVFVWGIISTPFWLFDVLVEFPLRELYRYGPSVMGWEGMPLAQICAQITYTGDEGFWNRNMEECERIYLSKEDAAMQVRKPLLIVGIIFSVFYMVKSIVEARALRRRERIDPDMVETFRAINMLSRQLRRAMNAR